MLTFLHNLNCCIGMLMFEMKSEICDFPKNKLKDVCFSTMKLYGFDKVEKNY